MIETTQKIIQIGSSQGVTLSKKGLVKLGSKQRDNFKLKVKLVSVNDKHEKLLHEYDVFVNKYEQSFKNLADK